MSTPLEHLEEAEIAIMTYMQRISELDPDGEDEDIELGNVMMAVLRHVSRAAGMLEAQKGE